jgi:hypothetical protein
MRGAGEKPAWSKGLGEISETVGRAGDCLARRAQGGHGDGEERTTGAEDRARGRNLLGGAVGSWEDPRILLWD